MSVTAFVWVFLGTGRKWLAFLKFLADTKHRKFDCLVLDIQLEGMSGLELRRTLSAVSDGSPIVFITAHDDPEVCAQTKASGCVGFFRQTDSGTDVLAAIRSITGREHSDAGRQTSERDQPS